MTATLTAMSWNVQGEIGIGDDRMQSQLDFLEDQTTDVDLFLFQAVNYEGRSGKGQLEKLKEYFSNEGYHIIHTGDWAQELKDSTIQPHAGISGAHNRCNLSASQWPIERRSLPLRNRGNGKPTNLNYFYAQFPEKILVGKIDLSEEAAIPTDTLETWNVGIINGANWGEEKLNMLETVYGRVYLQTTKTSKPVLVGGDFNAPKCETVDREIIPHGKNAGQYTNYPLYGDPYYLREGSEVSEFRFDQRWKLAEAQIFDPAVSEWNMRDAYWAAESSQKDSSTEDFTHKVPNGTPSKKRLDHILVSEQFTVRRCEIWNGTGSTIYGLGSSDHAPVVAELEIG